MKKILTISLAVNVILGFLYFSIVFSSPDRIIRKTDRNMYPVIKERNDLKKENSEIRGKYNQLDQKYSDLEKKFSKGLKPKTITVNKIIYVPKVDFDTSQEMLFEYRDLAIGFRTLTGSSLETSDGLERTGDQIIGAYDKDRHKLSRKAKRKFHLVIGPGWGINANGDFAFHFGLTLGYSVF